VEIAGTQKGSRPRFAAVGLIDRGLKGVRLVVSDGHEGIKAAVSGELAGDPWQRCIVRFTNATCSRRCRPPRCRRSQKTFRRPPRSGGRRRPRCWPKGSSRSTRRVAPKRHRSSRARYGTPRPTYSYPGSYTRGYARQTCWSDSQGG
jgi:hypothetical protein